MRIGKFAFVGGLNKVTKDILPYCIADGYPSVVRALNKVGLKRNGYTTEQTRAISDAYRILIRRGLPLTEALARLSRDYATVPEVREMVAFAAESKLGLARPRGEAS